MRSSLEKYNRAITGDIINIQLEFRNVGNNCCLTIKEERYAQGGVSILLIAHLCKILQGVAVSLKQMRGLNLANYSRPPKIRRVSQGFTFILAPLLFFHFYSKNRKGHWNIAGIRILRNKDSAYFCYCAYVLRILEWYEKLRFHSGTVVPGKTAIFSWGS